jgi:hypothetical protein
MAQATDNFVRADGALGSNWTLVPNYAEESPPPYTPASPGGILINNNGFGPTAAGGWDCMGKWSGGGTFQNAQWAVGTVKTVAAATATLSITAVAGSSSTWTYTFTVLTGSIAAALSNGHLYVIVSGMQNAANNGVFTSVNFLGVAGNLTSFTSSTFTVTNASGVAESGSTGSGYCSSDSGVGVGVRLQGTDATNVNGYFYHEGTNSFGGGGRKSYDELWKLVNGQGTLLQGTFDAGLALSPPVVGTLLGITVVNNTVTAYRNNSIFYTTTDTGISSGGVPGIWTWSMSGPNEYDFGTWKSTIQPPGNNGASMNAWSGGDGVTTSTQLISDTLTESAAPSDTFTYANGDLHTANANWVYEGSSTFTISSNICYVTAAQLPAFTYRSDAQPVGNDQWAQCTMHITGNSAQNCGPAVRIATGAQTAYAAQCATSLLRLIKYVNGTITVLGTASPNNTSNGDVILVTAIGSTITLYQNGTQKVQVTDTAITSGNVGIFGAGSGTLNGPSAFQGGSIINTTNNASNTLLPIGISTFSYSSNGALGLNTSASVTTEICLYENSLTWSSALQYAECVLPNASEPTKPIGPGILIQKPSSDAGYMFTHIGGNAILYRVNGGVTAINTVPHTYHAGDTYRIEAQGNGCIVGKINGTVAAIAIDTTYTTGVPGVFASQQEYAQTASTWAAGSVTIPPLTANVYSVPDCRVAPAGPNASRTVNNTKIYDVQTSSNPAIPPTDSRTAGAPVDSRVSPNIPQNSRTPGTYGPGE